MRAVAGFLVFNGLAVGLGLSLLCAAGLVRPRLSALLPAVPAALVTGVGTIGAFSVAALVLGVEQSAAVLVGAVVVATAVFAAIGLRRSRGAPDAEPELPWRSARVWLPVAAVAVFTLVQVILSWRVPIAWDAAHIWMVKAVSIFSTGGLDGQLFSEDGVLPTSHQDYPLLHPVVGALLFRLAATAQHGLLIGELWVLLGATVLAVPWLCRSGPATWLAAVPLALAVAAVPNHGILRGDADVPMACFLVVAAVCLARLLETSERGYAVPAALCLGAAANTKNEGLVFAVALVVCALAFALRRRHGGLTMAAVAGVLALLVAPWRLWVSAHGPFVADVTPLSTSLDAGFLVDRLDQLDLGAQELLGHFANPAYGWLVPAFLAVTIAALLSRRATGTAAFYLAGFVLIVLALLWVYWSSQQPDIVGHISRTTLRTVTAPLFLAAVALAHLLPQLVPAPALPAEREPAAAVVADGRPVS